MIDANEMVALIESCRREMKAMLPADEFASLSSKTRQDYRQLGRTLLQRARYAEGGAHSEIVVAAVGHRRSSCKLWRVRSCEARGHACIGAIPAPPPCADRLSTRPGAASFCLAF